MTYLRLKPRLRKVKDQILMAKESVDVAKAANDVGLICSALSNCTACYGIYRQYCVELDNRLASEYPIARVFQDLDRRFPSSPSAAGTAGFCPVREDLRRDNLGIACHLLVSHGSAASFADCVELDSGQATSGDVVSPA